MSPQSFVRKDRVTSGRRISSEEKGVSRRDILRAAVAAVITPGKLWPALIFCLITDATQIRRQKLLQLVSKPGL